MGIRIESFLKDRRKKDINVAIDNIYLGVVWISRDEMGKEDVSWEKLESSLSCSNKTFKSAIDSKSTAAYSYVLITGM